MPFLIRLAAVVLFNALGGFAMALGVARAIGAKMEQAHWDQVIEHELAEMLRVEQ